MMHSGNKTGMPLQIWAKAFVIAILLLVAFYLFLKIRDKLIDVRNSRVTEYSNSQNNKLDAYFLGSSLTALALIQYKSLDNSVSQNRKKFNYKVVVGRAICLKDINDKIPEIRDLRPRYLLIESNIACINMQGSVFWRWAKFRERLARIPIYFFNLGKFAFKLINNYVPDAFIEQNKHKLDIDNFDEKNVSQGGARFKIRKIDEFPEWNEFFKEAAILGIKIYLLEVPRSKEADQYLPLKFKQGYNSLIKQFKNDFNIEFIGFPEKLSLDKYYLDRAHFNESGSRYYSEWLLKELHDRGIIKCD